MLALAFDAVEDLHVVPVILQAGLLGLGDVALQVQVLLHILHVGELEKVVATLLEVQLTHPRPLQLHLTHRTRRHRPVQPR